MTPGDLLERCSMRELAEVLEFDALEPPLSRRDFEVFFGVLTALTNNAHFRTPKRPSDFYPSLEAAGETDADRRNRLRFRLAYRKAELEAMRHGKGQRRRPPGE